GILAMSKSPEQSSNSFAGAPPAEARLLTQRDSDAFRAGRDAVRQTHVPSAFALVHLEQYGRFAGRAFGGRLEDNEIAPHVSDADGCAIDDEPHLHLS